MARLDVRRVAGESPDTGIRAARGASSAPGSAVVASAQPAAAAKSGSSAVKVPLIVLAQFVRPSQYDGKSRSTFCILRSARLPLSFAASAPLTWNRRSFELLLP